MPLGVLGLLFFTALATCLQYPTGLDFGIDRFFTDPFVATKTAHPGRMSPNTAIAFLAVALNLFLRVYGSQRARVLVLKFLFGSIVLFLASVSLLGYIVAADLTLAWQQLTRMALHTSVCFF